MTSENGAPEEKITLSIADLRNLMNEAMVGAVRAAAELNNQATQTRASDVDFVVSLAERSPEERESALKVYLASLSPQERDQREGNIRSAYSAIPKTAEGSVPGAYVVTGKDHAGADVRTKVRTTRTWLEANYPMVDLFVTVIPRGGVIIKGVQYILQRGQQKVPSIVAEQYAWWADTQDRIEKSYPPITAAEEDVMKQVLARGAPRVVSRVHQVGLGILPPEVLATRETASIE